MVTVVHQEIITKGLLEYPNSIQFNVWKDIPVEDFSRPIVFCSLQTAARIRKNNPNLTNGLFFPDNFLHYAEYTAYIPDEWLLNPDFIILPYNSIYKYTDLLKTEYPEGVFIRPNSPLKPFTGFSKPCIYSALDEINSLYKLEKFKPSELCVISGLKPVNPVEWRLWLVDTEVVTYAPYSWEEGDLPTTPSKSVIDLGLKVAELMECHDNALVADIVETPDGPKVVELNAVSTSGWYKGLDSLKLVESLANLF